MQTHLTIPASISNAEVEKTLQNLQHQVHDFVDHQSRHDGEKSGELSELVYTINLVNPVKGMVQASIDLIRKTLLASSLAIDAMQTEKGAIIKSEAKKNLIHDKAQKLTARKRQLEAIALDLKKVLLAKYVFLVALIVGIGDALFSFSSFRHGGFSIAQSECAAIGVASVFSVSHYFYAGWIRQAASQKIKTFRVVLVLIAAFIFFAWLGFLRAAAANDTVNIALDTDAVSSSIPAVSGWAIAFISFILFLGVFGLALTYWKSPQDRQNEQAYEQLQKEIEEIGAEIAKVQAEKTTIETDAASQVRQARQIFEYATSSIRFCKNIGKHGIDRYKLVYSNFHNNGVPAYFANEPELQYEESFNLSPQA